jgi:hypothetical protein
MDTHNSKGVKDMNNMDITLGSLMTPQDQVDIAGIL